MGPRYCSHRPVRFVSGVEAPSSADALRVLHAVTALEQGESVSRRDGDDSASPELQDIRSRLDVLVTMVSQLLARQNLGELPPRADVTIGADLIEWSDDTGPQAGEGVIELYLSEAYPEPLRLHGALTTIGLKDADNPQRTLCSFKPGALDDDVDDALRRHVFRHHRREIARKQGNPVAR